jgi:hypothetical protein
MDPLITEPELAESPGQRIPPDILIDIFTDISGCRDAWLTEAGPMLLGMASVCRLWRDVVLGVPSLWTTIRLRQIDEPPPGSDARLPLLLELYVSHSKNLPLQIHVFMWNCSHDESLFDILVQHSNRWRKVDFCIPLSLVHKLNAVKGKVPLLESVEMNALSDVYYDGIIVDCFESAPALKAFKLHHRLLDIRVPWTQITDYTTNCVPLSSNFHDAALCSNLTSLTLIDWVRFGAMTGFCTLPNLRNLELFATRGCIRTSVLDIFSYITVPHLTALKVHAFNSDSGFIWRVPHFFSMVDRIAVTLPQKYMDESEYVHAVSRSNTLCTEFGDC